MVADDEVEVRLDGDDLGLLIGPRGQTLQAVQDLTRLAVQRRDDDRSGRPAHRHRRLPRASPGGAERFTEQVVAQVVSSGEPGPSSRCRRRTARSSTTRPNELAGVEHRSEGEEPFRRVVILPADGLTADRSSLRRVLAEEPAPRSGSSGPADVDAAIEHAARFALALRPARADRSTSAAAAACPGSCWPSRRRPRGGRAARRQRAPDRLPAPGRRPARAGRPGGGGLPAGPRRSAAIREPAVPSTPWWPGPSGRPRWSPSARRRCCGSAGSCW